MAGELMKDRYEPSYSNLTPYLCFIEDRAKVDFGRTAAYTEDVAEAVLQVYYPQSFWLIFYPKP